MFRVYPQTLLQGPGSLRSRRLWEEFDKPGTTPVHVGETRGSISTQLAGTTKNIDFAVDDRPETVKLGEEDLPVEHQGRISFRVDDFFQEKPIKVAEIDFFRKILHD